MNFEIEQIIQQLNSLQVDGETMEYIIKAVGMEDQILRQLVMSEPIQRVEQLYQERLDFHQDMARYWLYESC